MPLLHGGAPSSKRQLTFSLIHLFLSSFPLALHVNLKLALGPYAASSLLLMISLWPLH
jgi:hypothetical protein